MQWNLLGKLGPNSCIQREYLGDRRIVLTLSVRLERHKWGEFSFILISRKFLFALHLCILAHVFCVVAGEGIASPLDGILMASTLI
jgi:hypothetical protein